MERRRLAHRHRERAARPRLQMPALRQGQAVCGLPDLRPRCEACGLDYAFIDAGDGPAIFIIMIAGAIVVGSRADRRDQIPAAVLAACGAVAAADSRHHAAAAALDEVAADRAAVPSQGRRRPADRSRAEMNAIIATRRGVAGFGIFTLADGGAVRRPRRLAVAAPGREARADRGADRAARRARPAPLPPAAQWSALTPAQRRIPPRQLYRDLSSPVRMRWSTAPARRCATMSPAPAPGRSCPRACRRRDRRGQCRLRAEHDAGPRPAGSRGDAARHRRSR